MTEIPLTEQDELDLALLGTAQPPQHSLLTIWTMLLDEIDTSRAEPIPVGVAAKVVASWPFLTFQETAIYHERYHARLADMRDILRNVISIDPDATSFTGDDDARENHAIYRDLLVAWHIKLDDLEHEWRAEHPVSHIDVAVISDVRAFIFAQTGLAGHLDAIGYQLGDDEFLNAVRAVREEQGE